jgi:hypothetical protein
MTTLKTINGTAISHVDVELTSHEGTRRADEIDQFGFDGDLSAESVVGVGCMPKASVSSLSGARRPADCSSAARSI